jgi:hypothetical protein
VSGVLNGYKDDIDVNQLKSELIKFLNLTKEDKIDSPLEMYKLLLNGLRSTFPNTETILKNLFNNASQQCQWRTLVFCSEKNKKLFEEYIISK